MFSQPLHLVCSILAFSIIPFSSAQATATATENGIVSAAGGPEPTQSVSYSIEGAPAASLTTSASLTPSTTHTSNSDSLPMSGENSSLANNNQHRLSTPAILGITLAVLLAVIGILIAVIVLHRRRSQDVGRAKRKSIMDMEFAAASKADLTRVDTAKSGNIGYFDIAKPLPAVVKHIEDDRLSRSSTIIGDAAEVAQINRKVSSHQKKQKEAREAVRERNHALQILITNEDNRTSVLPTSPLTSNPSTPVDANMDPNGTCRDNDGDAFAKRPSKI